MLSAHRLILCVARCLTALSAKNEYTSGTWGGKAAKKGRTSCAQIGAALSLPFDHAMSVESRMMPQHTALAQGVIQQLYVVILRSFVFQKQIVGFCLLEARLNGR